MPGDLGWNDWEGGSSFLAGVANLGHLLSLPLPGEDSMFEKDANTKKSGAERWRACILRTLLELESPMGVGVCYRNIKSPPPSLCIYFCICQLGWDPVICN